MGLLKNYTTTLYKWLNGFAPTYRSPILASLFDEEHPKPDTYIEYSADLGNFNSEFIQAITIYTQATGFNDLMDIADKIEEAIKEKGIKLTDDWGYITINKGNPFYQDKPDEDEDIRAGYINLLIKVYQNNV